jgi:predicted DNA-binding transcriptional regulator YafY
MSRSIRLLALLQFLRGRRVPVTASQIAHELQVSERTVYRDIATLVAQGAPVKGEGGVGYVLKPGLFLPPLMLQGEEVEAVLLGLRYVDQRGDEPLRKAAAVAAAKIDAVLSSDARAAGEASITLPGPPRHYPTNAVPLSILRDAIRKQHRLTVAYADAEGRLTSRTIWPFALAFADSARVLAAWCELRVGFRMFRTDRIASAEIGDRYPEHRSALLKRFHAQVAAADEVAAQPLTETDG